MSDTFKIKRGLDIPVSGAAQAVVKKVEEGIAAVCPDNFKGLAARLLVKEGDRVLAGSPVVSDKNHPEILLTSSVSGTVSRIVRGDKRKLLAVEIEPDGNQGKTVFPTRDPSILDAQTVKEALLESGLWPFIIQRPYGVVADPGSIPKAIFISAFSTAPLATDTEFTLCSEINYIQAAVTALGKVAPVHLSVKDDSSVFSKIHDASIHVFKGKHPAGNVGVQISHVSPVSKGQTVWTVSPEGLAAIGRLFLEGCYDVRRKVAVCGPAAKEPAYVEALPGICLKHVAALFGELADGLRIISGDILSGQTAGQDGYLGFFHNQVTLIKEGTGKELLGWMRPLRLNQFSADRTYFSWLLARGRKYDMDTNLHGGPRAFVMSDGYYSKVLPMDLYPLYLIKACIAGDIEKMEQFGIYEVLPEDLALCEYIDPSKNYIQDIIAKGIDLMLKEMT